MKWIKGLVVFVTVEYRQRDVSRGGTWDNLKEKEERHGYKMVKGGSIQKYLRESAFLRSSYSISRLRYEQH